MPLSQILRRGRTDEAKRIGENKSDDNLTGKNIRDALEHVCHYLAERKVDIDLVAVESTFDALWYTKYTETPAISPRSAFGVDFLHIDHDGAIYKDMKDAIAYARVTTGVNIQGGWMQHQHPCLHGHAHTRRLDLVRQSKVQDEVMFHRTGLTVYSAPWHFLFINKVVRLCRRGVLASDVEYKDAVFFLRQYIYLKQNKTGSVTEIDIKSWLDQYSLSAQGGRAELVNVLSNVASQYQEEYSEGGAIEQALIYKRITTDRI